jgi:hypothetical protein
MAAIIPSVNFVSYLQPSSRTHDGQPGSYRFVGRISTDKRPCVDRPGQLPVVGYPETARSKL